MDKERNKERIFIALRPDTAASKRLIKLQQQLSLGGRLTPPPNLHLTLAFVGDCDAARKQCVFAALATVDAAAFEIRLSELGYFERQRIFYIAPPATPPALLSLHEQLCRALSPCHFKTPRAFKPHITLFRGVKTPPFCDTTPESIAWRAHSFCVERSDLSAEGARYTTLKSYPLS